VQFAAIRSHDRRDFGLEAIKLRSIVRQFGYIYGPHSGVFRAQGSFPSADKIIKCITHDSGPFEGFCAGRRFPLPM
jgi:hypothetical protein